MRFYRTANGQHVFNYPNDNKDHEGISAMATDMKNRVLLAATTSGKVLVRGDM